MTDYTVKDYGVEFTVGFRGLEEDAPEDWLEIVSASSPEEAEGLALEIISGELDLLKAYVIRTHVRLV